MIVEEELRSSQLEYELLIATLNEFEVLVLTLENILAEEALNGIAVLPELKRVHQDIERMESENKELRRATEIVLDAND